MSEKKEIYFHASSFGNIMVKPNDIKITPSQLKEIDRLIYERDNLKNERGNTVKWTSTKQEDLEYLIAKRDAKPFLSETAKGEVEKLWRFLEKGFVDELNTKQIEKGFLQEEEGIEILSEVDGVFYTKNSERLRRDNLTGEADIIYTNEDGRKKIIDIKCSWDMRTFMNSTLSNIYEWQLRVYMYLYDAQEAELVYVLVDTPKHLIEKEKRQLFFKYKSDAMSDEELTELEMQLEPLYAIIEKNHTYSQNPNIKGLDERVMRFKVYRSRELEKDMLETLQLALEYYPKIQMNQSKRPK